MSTTRPSRIRCSLRLRQPFESLEDRRLLSADHSVVAMDWRGHRVEAEAGQYILSLDPSAGGVKGQQGDAQVKAVQRALDETLPAIKVEQYLGQSGQFLV